MQRQGAGTQQGQGGGSSAHRRAAILGIIAWSLLTALGCSAGTGADTGTRAGAGRIGSAPPSVAPVPAPGASGQAVDPAQAALEAVLRSAVDGGKPNAEQLRTALVAAGFSAGDVQVTAGRTPTGLQADAVEVGVKQGRDCLVAQIRSSAVTVAILPVLADGRCLVGAAVP